MAITDEEQIKIISLIEESKRLNAGIALLKGTVIGIDDIIKKAKIQQSKMKASIFKDIKGLLEEILLTLEGK